MSETGTDISNSSCGSGYEIEYTFDCAANSITITKLSGNGPLYRIYKHDQVSPHDEFVWHEEKPHGSHENIFPYIVSGVQVVESDENGNPKKYLYLLIESCGCCKEIIIDCVDVGTTPPPTTTTTTTTTTSTTPAPSTPPPTTPPPTTTSTTTPCCPPSGEWYWKNNSPPSTSVTSSTDDSSETHSSVDTMSNNVTLNADAGVVYLGAGNYDIDLVDYDSETDPTRYIVSANGALNSYYLNGDLDSVAVDSTEPWNILVQRLNVYTEEPVVPLGPINVGSTSSYNPIASLTDRSTQEIQALVGGLEPGPNTKNIYTNYNNRNIGRFTRNDEFWGKDLKGITGISPYLKREPGSALPTQRWLRHHGVAITPRHILISKHVGFHDLTPGNKIGFIDRDNNSVERTMLGNVSGISPIEGDFNISVLDEDLPSNVEILRVMPTDILSQIPNSDLIRARGGATIRDGQILSEGQELENTYQVNLNGLLWGTNQEEEGILFRGAFAKINDSDSNTFDNSIYYYNKNLGGLASDEWGGDIKMGDSSSPAFFIVNNEAILAGITSTDLVAAGFTGGTNSIETLNSLIDRVDNEVLGFSTGYTVNPLSNSEFIFNPETETETDISTLPPVITVTETTTPIVLTPTIVDGLETTTVSPVITTDAPTTLPPTTTPKITTTKAPPTTPSVPETTLFPPAPPVTTFKPTVTLGTTQVPETVTPAPTTAVPTTVPLFDGPLPTLPPVTTTPAPPPPKPGVTTTPFPLAPPVTTPDPTTQVETATTTSTTTLPPVTTDTETNTSTPDPEPSQTTMRVSPFVDLGSALSQSSDKSSNNPNNPYPTKKSFVPHYMYDSLGRLFWADTFEKHQLFNELGFTHEFETLSKQVSDKTNTSTKSGEQTNRPSSGQNTSPPSSPSGGSSYYSSYNNLESQQEIEGIWSNPLNQIQPVKNAYLQQVDGRTWLLQIPNTAGSRSNRGVEGAAGIPHNTSAVKIQAVGVGGRVGDAPTVQRVNFELPIEVDFAPLFEGSPEPITIERNANGEIISIDLSESFEGVTAEIIEKNGVQGVRLIEAPDKHGTVINEPVEISLENFEEGIKSTLSEQPAVPSDSNEGPPPAVPSDSNEGQNFEQPSDNTPTGGGNIPDPLLQEGVQIVEDENGGAADVVVPGENRPRPGYPGNIGIQFDENGNQISVVGSGDMPQAVRDALTKYFNCITGATTEEERKKCIDEYYEEVGELQEKKNNIFEDMNWVDINGNPIPIEGIVVSYKGKCYKIIDPDKVAERSSGKGVVNMDQLCNPPVTTDDDGNDIITPGWEECPCCPPDKPKTTPPPTTPPPTTPPVTPPPTTPPVTPPPTTTSTTTSTTPSPTTTSTTTPCCTPECSPPAERLGMWFYEDAENNYSRPYKYIIENGAVFWEGPEFEGTPLEEEIAMAALENDGPKLRSLLRQARRRGMTPEEEAQLSARVAQWREEYFDEDKRRCFFVYDADWVNANKEKRPSEDVEGPNSKVANEELGFRRGLGWEECECCPCCPPTDCDVCWFYKNRRNNILAYLGMAFQDQGFPEGVRFRVKEGVVVKHCCDEPPFINEEFVDDVIRDAFKEGKKAREEFKLAEDAWLDATNKFDEGLLDQEDLDDAIEFRDNARNNLNNAQLDYFIAKGNIPAVANQIIQNEVDEFGMTPQQIEGAQDNIRQVLQILRDNPGVPFGDLEVGDGPGEIPKALIDDIDANFGTLPEESLEAALERQRLIENDDNWTGPADGNKLSEDDIIDGDELDADAKQNLDKVAKTFNKDCAEVCRPVCFKVIDPFYVQDNPMLNPAIDVLSHVNDTAINPQNKEKPAKLTIADLESGDKGKGWEMCECCPCPELPNKRPPGPNGGGQQPQPQEPEVVITGGGAQIPVFDSSILTTPPVVLRTTTTTRRVDTTPRETPPPPPTTICPPDSRGGPRCNVLKW